MILLILGVAGATLAGFVVAFLAGIVTKSILLRGLVWTVVTSSLAFFPIAASVSQPALTSGIFSHDQLDADRAMTQQMAVVVGPGMDAQMVSDGMLARSANAAYTSALEQHVAEFDRMLGQAP